MCTCKDKIEKYERQLEALKQLIVSFGKSLEDIGGRVTELERISFENINKDSSDKDTEDDNEETEELEGKVYMSMLEDYYKKVK